MNQYYRVHAVIDLDAICHNIREVKRVVGEGVKVMPVIKADGYGHGAVPIAKELNKIGVDAFAVAILEEGITLRNNGIRQPILILGYTSEYQYSSLIQYEIEPTVFCYEMAESLSKIAQALGKDAKIHIKLDTGMNRIGFKPTKESVDIIEKIAKLPNIKIQGIFTHFACADEADKTETYEQERKYDQKEISIFQSNTYQTVHRSLIWMDLEKIWYVQESLLMDYIHQKKFQKMYWI